MCDFLHKTLSKIELESDEKSSATVRNVHVFPLKHFCRLQWTIQNAALHLTIKSTCPSIKRKPKIKINNVMCKFIFPIYFDETGKRTNKNFQIHLNP